MKDMETHRYERVILETVRHRIEGTVALSRDGYRSRLSDLLNACEREFLSLTDATVTELEGDENGGALHPVVVVSCRQIVLAIPLGAHHPQPPSSPPPLAAV